MGKDLFEIKQLGQLRPKNTTAVSIYSPAAGVKGELDFIWVCNVDSSAHKFRIFFNNNGIMYDNDSALGFDQTLEPGQWASIDLHSMALTERGNFAVRTDSPNKINFILFGKERTKIKDNYGQ